MLINAGSLKAIFVSLKTIFNNAFDAAPSQWQQVAMLVQSTGKSNDYAWLSSFPRMRKWIGEKAVKALAASQYTIVNDDWEATVEVDRNDIKDDQLGIYRPQAEMAGFSAKQLPDEIIFDLVSQGFTRPCYDGQYFFDTDHPVNGQSVSNKGTKKLSIATLAAARASYGAARTAMKKFRDDEGRPLNITPSVLLVPSALEDDANLLMTVERLEDGKPNPYRNTATVVVAPWLTSDTAWFLLDTSKPVKPFIYQEREKPVFVQQTDPQADDVFNRKKFKFGAEARAAGGYGFWQLAYGSTGEEA
ncbi:Mu-like prophage major head subunit gpT family protein [Laribacter hongkongensis]|uniref:Head protein n=10 Tax=Laribacter hongkongensis TaxID=168471 RepID=A0A248LI43_9NEIS|nr:Mu-like prophage major head subunit gpT family protein [Laribacter hongkongensis]ASJ24151.1 head protein [Laribacter hongkongensis]ASJ26217.1 head protein [Laribacter hongkongensis]MBE5529210.1 head protein [Laribacter hongkongensis]MCG8996639.1 Mu-like prophage major head subunit gpT family protein [Laribacter hongkongensis]MCG9011884.1 Mu-like prophage major head subunit gpT family protein [Laribacter hongkongensis]